MFEFSRLSQYKNYVEKRQGRKLILFGAGDNAHNIINRHFRHDEIHAVWDNTQAKQGKQLFGITVTAPPPPQPQPIDDCVVLITITDELGISEITEQLKNAGIQNIYDVDVLNLVNTIERYNNDWSKKFHELNAYEIIENNMDKIQQVRKLITDEKSLYVYDAIVEKTKYNLGDYSDICDDVWEHYFSDGIFEYGDNEVLIDGGAYLGEDTVRLARLIGKDKIRRSYCFEPDLANYTRCVKNLLKFFGEQTGEETPGYYKGNQFIACKSGLWNENNNVEFVSYGTHNSVFAHLRNASANESIPAVRLDDIVYPEDKVTLIKMDIEGAEIPALQGAEQIIKRDKPKLAICAYHMVEDLWTIPTYIKSLVPEYKLYVRHHTPQFWDSVVYATI